MQVAQEDQRSWVAGSAGIGCGRVETGIVVMDLENPTHDIPAQADIQGETAGRLPIVGHIEGGGPDTALGIDLVDGEAGLGYRAQHKAGEGVAGGSGILRVGSLSGTKGKRSRSVAAVILIIEVLADLRAPPDGVAAVDPGGVVGHDIAAVRFIAGVTPPQDGEGAALSGGPRPSDLRESGLGNAGQPDFARPILVQGE